MSDYIEREAIKFETWTTWPLREQITVVRKKAIESIPAADVAPVRHGRWEQGDMYDYGDVCSLCDWDSERTPCTLPYCPDCGAKMDLEEQT